MWEGKTKGAEAKEHLLLTGKGCKTLCGAELSPTGWVVIPLATQKGKAFQVEGMQSLRILRGKNTQHIGEDSKYLITMLQIRGWGGGVGKAVYGSKNHIKNDSNLYT